MTMMSICLGVATTSGQRMLAKEEGRGTRNGYEASKGSKGISGL